MASKQTSKPFGEALYDLLRESEYVTKLGSPNWHAFAADIPGLHYESLRKVVAGERNPTENIIEQVAVAMRVRPEYFAEYRLMEARALFDVGEVGLARALENYEKWCAAENHGSDRKPARS